ncbi:MAG: hypothetical protein QE271_07065 [Bacteriovoracaceae bacterium]|nr:hypothetical protein [Bacteriovoracaceae bacterium]
MKFFLIGFFIFSSATVFSQQLPEQCTTTPKAQSEITDIEGGQMFYVYGQPAREFYSKINASEESITIEGITLFEKSKDRISCSRQDLTEIKTNKSCANYQCSIMAFRN